ncbi:MAG: DUF192 domain-containing protein [Erysipelotrichia bacterium]|nr:DUF192 domain-containing protein [Erysipelotrichia bacterium]
MFVRFINERDQMTVGNKIKVATTFWQRFRGMMLTTEPTEGEGLLLSPCNSIHMMFMLYPIDAIFLDADNNIKAIYEHLSPWIGFSRWHTDVSSVLELKSGTIKKSGVRLNDTLRMEQLEC